MKKIIILLFSFLFLGGFCNADLAGFTIESYTSNFKLRDDGILEAVENINVNFSEHRHGIYRTIPYIYSNYLKTPIKKVKVPGYKFTTSKEGNNFMIKIGSARKTVIGKQNYSIQYRIKGSIRNFSGYQELYRNVLGTEWDTPVNNFNFSLELPSILDLKGDDIWVYIGEKGSNNITKATISGNIISNDEPLNLGARQGVTLAVKLPANYVPTKKYYSLKGRFKYYGKEIGFSIRCITTFSILFFVFRELTKRYQKRRQLRQTHGKKIRDVIYYTPPKGYTAMEIAAIYNWKSNFDVFSAFLYNWIADGYVYIEEVKIKKMLGLRYQKKYHFRISTSNPKFKFDERIHTGNYLYFINPEERFWKLCFFQNDINDLNSFGVSDSSLLKKIADETFYQIHTKFIPCWKDLYKVKNLSSNQYKYSKDKFYKKVHLNGFWDGKPGLNGFIAILWIFISSYLIANIYGNLDSDLWPIFFMSFWAIIVIYLIFLLVLRFINRKFHFKIGGLKLRIGKDIKYISGEGIDIIEQTLGFRKYLLSVDDEKLRTLLNEDPTYFEKYLPYAIALDVGKHWIKRCVHILEDLDYKPEGIDISNNNRGNAFISDLDIGNHISSTVYHIDHPSNSGGGSSGGGSRGSSFGGSSGGGSSGGGGGGGGGGSW